MAADRMLRWMAPVSALLLIGCGRKSESVFPTWSPAHTPYSAQPNSSNTFDAYVLAAQIAEQKGGPNLDRVAFFPGHKKAATKDIAEALMQVVAGSRKPCDFRFTPSGPFEKRPYVRGWRLIGRVFAWQIADAAKSGNYGKAVSLATTGSKFGFDLTGGDALTASLGLSIVNDIRRSLLPALEKLSAVQLESLASGMAEALNRRAPVEETVANEKQNMLVALQSVQDDFRSDRLEELDEQLGSSAKDGIDYLRALKSEKPEKQVEYFKNFGSEAETIANWASKAGEMPTKDRPKLELPKERPWKRISRHFFGTLQPLMAMEDETVARTRLLIVFAKLKAGTLKKAPPSLTSLDPKLVEDPYSGKPFLLHSDDLEFSVYSVGPNLKDDGGDTDETFTRPDLLIEQPN